MPASRRIEALAFAFVVISASAATSCGGNRGSIGVVAAHENATGRIVVKEVPDGLAGARAGIEVGDEILAVDGRPVHDMTAAEFREAVRGDIGTRVTLTVLRNGLKLVIGVERGAFK